MFLRIFRLLMVLVFGSLLGLLEMLMLVVYGNMPPVPALALFPILVGIAVLFFNNLIRVENEGSADG